MLVCVVCYQSKITAFEHIFGCPTRLHDSRKLKYFCLKLIMALYNLNTEIIIVTC